MLGARMPPRRRPWHRSSRSTNKKSTHCKSFTCLQTFSVIPSLRRSRGRPTATCMEEGEEDANVPSASSAAPLKLLKLPCPSAPAPARAACRPAAAAGFLAGAAALAARFCAFSLAWTCLLLHARASDHAHVAVSCCSVDVHGRCRAIGGARPRRGRVGVLLLNVCCRCCYSQPPPSPLLWFVVGSTS